MKKLIVCNTCEGALCGRLFLAFCLLYADKEYCLKRLFAGGIIARESVFRGGIVAKESVFGRGINLRKSVFRGIILPLESGCAGYMFWE